MSTKKTEESSDGPTTASTRSSMPSDKQSEVYPLAVRVVGVDARLSLPDRDPRLKPVGAEELLVFATVAELDAH